MNEVKYNPQIKLSKKLDKHISKLLAKHIFSEDDLCNLYMMDPHRVISRVNVSTEISINDELELDSSRCPTFTFIDTESLDVPDIITPDEIDESNESLSENQDEIIATETLDEIYQSNWFVPETYKDFDIAKFVIDLCETEEELQRVGKELIMFQERDLFPLLRYLKYLVDTMRSNNIVWGVGRGSSVSSYVLFLLGVHKINSIYYDLEITDFLKEN